MDGQRFDNLTRRLASGTSRRSLLKGLAGGLVAALGVPLADRGLAAAKVRVCHLTGSGNNPVQLIEVDARAVAAHEAHGDVIAPDFQNDPNNCGGCLIRCDDADPCTNDACVGGTCVHTPVECPTCRTCAGGECVADAAQEGDVCGDDGNSCTDEVCRAGTCVLEAAPGRGCDDGDACTSGDVCQSNGSCAGTPINCEVCHACSGGDCRPAASDARCPTVCCDGACVSPHSDEANCGACGNACAAGSLCCGGTCRNVQIDPSNCGGCGDICAIDDICVNGNCQLAACKADGNLCHDPRDCCSGQCNGTCFCSLGDFPVGDACQTDANCCQGRCIAGACVCFDPGFPPAPGLNGPCLSDRDCCSGSCLLDPTGTVGLCTCLPIGVPCDNQFQCCSGNCNDTPFEGRLCSPFE